MWLCKGLDKAKIKNLFLLSSIREASIVWLSMVFGAIFAFFTQVLLARTLSVSDYGAIATVLSITSILGPIGSLGVGGYWLLIFGREGWKAKPWLGPSFHLVCLSSSIAMCLLLIWAALGWTDEIARNLVYWLFPIILMQALIELNISKSQLEGKFMLLAMWQFLPHVGRVIIALMALILKLNINAVAIGYSITTLIIIILNIISILPVLKGSIALKGHGAMLDEGSSDKHSTIKIRSVLYASWPFGLSGILGLFYGRSDIVIIGLLRDTESAGLYYAAVSVLAVLYLLPEAVNQKYLLPKIQRWAAHDYARFLAYFRFGSGVMLFLGVIAMACLCIGGPIGLPLLFGKAYSKSGTLLLLLSLCVPLRFLASNIDTVLVTGENMKRKNLYQGFVVLISFSLNLLLIPVMGIYGAAIAKVVSELSLVLFYLMGAKKHVFGNDALRGWTLKIKVLNV